MVADAKDSLTSFTYLKSISFDLEFSSSQIHGCKWFNYLSFWSQIALFTVFKVCILQVQRIEQSSDSLINLFYS